MVFEDYHAGLAWIADGYKHKLFANECRKSTEVLPQDDSFALLPSEKTDTYAEVRLKPPSPLEKHFRKARTTRPGTAPPRFNTKTQERPWSSKSSRSYLSTDSQSPRAPTQPRIRSAGSAAERHRAVAKMRSGFTLVNKLYEDASRRQNINLHPASPAPDYRYFDRHSRCHDYNHMHDILLHDRPQTACDLEPCSLHSRPLSSMSNYSKVSSTVTEEQIDTMKQPRRYINYHRPRTAPSYRSDFKSFQRRNNSVQGSRPRFCNIVRSVQLHDRDGRDLSPCTGDSGFDEFDYLTKDGRLINRWRRESNTRSGKHARKAIDIWIRLGEDDFGNRVNFRPNYTFGLYSSIPEHPDNKQDDLSKGAGSGFDGKPGTPISINDDMDRIDLNNMNNDNDNDSEGIQLVPPVVIVERMQDDDDDLKNKDKNILKIPIDSTYKSDDNQDNRLAESPTQPPPSPEPVITKQPVKPPSPPPQKRRSCITKKTLDKKPISRKKKQEMEKPNEEPPPREPTPPPPAPVVEEIKESDLKVNLPEPALPEFKESTPKSRKEKGKPEKFAITKPERNKVEDDTLFNDTLTEHLKKFELMVSDMTSPEESPRKHTNRPQKVTGRLALSQQSSRFTLPIDMKELETMSPKEYIVNYCKITKRRQNLYDNVYRQTVGTVTKPMPFKELEKALKNVLVDTLNHEHYMYICELLELKEGEDLNAELFAKMAALAERLLYPQYVTKETEDHKDYQKELIEVADFSALEWKFHGVNVRQDIQKLLKTLC